MADTPNNTPPSGGGGNQNPKPTGYTETTVHGEPINHQSADETKTLIKGLEELGNRLIEELPVLMATRISSELESGKERSGNTESSGTKRFESSRNRLSIDVDNIDDTLYSVKHWQEKLRDLTKESALLYATNLKGELIGFAASVKSGRKAVEDFTQILNDSRREYSKTGLASFTSLILNDIMPSAVSLKNTMGLIMENAREQNLAYMASGDTVEEFGKRMYRARAGMEESGADMYSMIGFKDQEKLLSVISDSLVRQGSSYKIDSVKTQNLTTQAFKFYSQIARNTGLTVDELIKMNSKDVKTNLEEAKARGFLSEEAVINLDAASKALNGIGADSISQIIGEAAKMGGSAMVPLALQRLGRLDLISAAPQIQKLMDSSRNGSLNDQNLATHIRNIGKGLSGWQGSLLPGMSDNQYLGQNTASLVGVLQKYGENQKAANENKPILFVERFLNKFDAFLNDNPMLKMFVDIGSSLYGLTTAITLNTAAILASNPFLKGIAGKSLRGIKGLLGFGPKQLELPMDMAKQGAFSKFLSKLNPFSILNLKKLESALKTVTSKSMFKVAGVVASVYELGSIISNWGDKFDSMADTNKTTLQKHANIAGQSIFELGTTLAMTFGGPVGLIIGGILKLADYMTGGLVSETAGLVVEKIVSWVSTFSTWVYDFINNLLSSAWNGVKSFFGFSSSGKSKVSQVTPSKTATSPQSLADYTKNVAIKEIPTQNNNQHIASSDEKSMSDVLAVLQRTQEVNERMLTVLNGIRGNTQGGPSYSYG